MVKGTIMLKKSCTVRKTSLTETDLNRVQGEKTGGGQNKPNSLWPEFCQDFAHQNPHTHRQGGSQPHRWKNVKGRGAPLRRPHGGHCGGDELDGGSIAHHQHTQTVRGHAGALLAMPRAASSPRGVAAFPSPRRLAETLAEMLSITARSRAIWGKSRRSTGPSRRDSRSARPDRRMTSITPVHRHIIPAMERHSSTAAEVPSTAGGGHLRPSAGGQTAQHRDDHHPCPDYRHRHTAHPLLSPFIRAGPGPVCLPFENWINMGQKLGKYQVNFSFSPFFDRKTLTK